MKCWPMIIAICVLVSIETMAGYMAAHAAVASEPAQTRISKTIKMLAHKFGFVRDQSLYRSKRSPSPDLCSTPECLSSALRIRRNMNPNVDPCDNFHDFACGGFINSTTIPGDGYIVNSATIIDKMLQEQLRTIIQADIKPNALKPFTLVKTLYNNCMNTQAIEFQGLEPFRKFLNEHGGWPVLEDGPWNDNNTLQTVIVIDSFSEFDVFADLKNKTEHVILLNQGTQGLDREYLSKGFENDRVQDYYRYMVDVAVILGADRSRAETELKESLLFEIEIANNTLPAEESRDLNQFYNPMTVKQLMNNYSTLPWKEYFIWRLSPIDKVNDDDIVIVTRPQYIAKMEELISKTPKRVQANYAMWQWTRFFAPFLTVNIRKIRVAYITAFTGQSETQVREEECVGVVKTWLELSLSTMYLRKHLNSNIKSEATAIVTNVKKQFDEMLKQAEWLDNRTKQTAQDKLAKMSSVIASRDQRTLDNELEDYYRNLELSEGLYFHSIFNITEFKKHNLAGKMRQPVKKNDWTVYGNWLKVDAQYVASENIFQLPAVSLQGNYFNVDRPKYMNYGGIGLIAGHEIVHGFDDQGRLFDENGNLNDWWSSSTKEQFVAKAQCIIDQYGNYTVDEVGLNINGVNTQGENIADNGGLKAAYRAYIKWASITNVQEKRLPELPYTPKQMFWISVANTWCSKIRPKILKAGIETGVHTPDEFRIIGSLSNMPEFSTDFNCRIGSNMNPVEKCTVW